MSISATAFSFEVYYCDRYTTLSVLSSHNVAIMRIHGAFIPMTDYQNTLNRLSELVRKENIQKLIVDAQELVAYHQPSLEWYMLNWQQEMYQCGLTQYRYLPGKNGEYQKKMKNGITKIRKDNPHLAYLKQIDVLYCHSLEDAIAE